MCGRYPFVPSPTFIKDNEIENDDFVLRPNYNTAPGQLAPVMTMNSPKTLKMMRWGLIPSWAKDTSFAYKTINARSEEVDKKASYRGPLKNQRYAILAHGFYEWFKDNKQKIPYLFTVKGQQDIFFAGLYDIWIDPEGNEVWSFTILTTQANELVAKVHDRMTVILHPKDIETWLDNSEYDPKKLAPLMQPNPAKEMESYRVSQEVNSPKNNTENLLLREPLNSK